MDTLNDPPRKYKIWERILLSFVPCPFPFGGIALAQLMCILTGQYHPVRDDAWSPQAMPIYYAHLLGQLCITFFFSIFVFVETRQDRGEELDQNVRQLYFRNWIFQLALWLLFIVLAVLRVFCERMSFYRI
jgi:hypothetical protein